MRACGDFRILAGLGKVALARLRAEAATATLTPDTRSSKHAIAITTIDLLNMWSAFSKHYALSCIMSPRRSSGGRVKVTRTGLDFNGVIGIAVLRHNKRARPQADGSWHRRNEPPWHDTTTLTSLCTDLGCSHLADIQAAVSLGSRVFTDLPVFRNFVAHRNKGTAKAAKDLAPQYSIASSHHPVAILATPPHGRPNALLVEWIDDLAVTVELLCQ